jgi:hypothetical protein
MIRMVSLWSSISLWADRGDDQRDAGDVIAGRDDLKKPRNTRDLLNLREKYFCVAGDNIPCGGSEWPGCRDIYGAGPTAKAGPESRVLPQVDLETNHSRQDG